MKLDILIKNGHVVDPETGRDKIADIGIASGKIAAAGGEAARTIDASGCYVTPGLIDFHTHLFSGGSAFGIRPDFLPAYGITSAVDQGTAGCANYELFYSEAVVKSKVRVKSLINVCSYGLPGYGNKEYPDPNTMQREKICRLAEKYAGNLFGLKIRIAVEFARDIGEEALRAASSIAREANLRLCAHVTNSPLSAEKILSIFRPGDIFCHTFHGQGNSQIVDKDGKLFPAVLEAQKRGVIFDTAEGHSNFNAATAKSALAQGFLPNVISTDSVFDTLSRFPTILYLPFVMSQYLNMGVSMTEIIRRVTETPAKLMGMAGKTGTLREGALADVCILKEKKKKVSFPDFHGQATEGDRILVPQVTILDGQILYAQTDFTL